jgi:hypothetical protein
MVGEDVRVEGQSFSLGHSVDELCVAIQRDGQGALLFRTIEYAKTLSALLRLVEARYGKDSPQYRDVTPSAILCAGCLWEFPFSFKLSLQGGMQFAGVSGARPGAQAFGRSGACPHCHSDTALLIYQCFLPREFGQSDHDVIMWYWRTQANAWWRNEHRKQALCDLCSGDVTWGQGYLSGTDLLCDSCVQCHLQEGLIRLPSNPHYFGENLLRKAYATPRS